MNRGMIDILKPLAVGGLRLKNRLLLAPVDGVFDRSFRVLAMRHGVALTCSEMICARGIRFNKGRLLQKIRPAGEEKPYQVQLSDHEPGILAEAARFIEGEGLADIIDLNMGCPSRLVVRSGNGAALMRDPKLVARIVQSVRGAIGLPLSIKIRAGWDDTEKNAVEIAGIAASEGADMVTVHGRTRAGKFSVPADWTVIAAVKAALAIPVIGNGDVFSAGAARSLMRKTGCDGVMIARGAFGEPWLIDRILKDDDGIRPSLDERRREILGQIAIECGQFEEATAVKRMRKHLAWYVKGLPGAAIFRREAFVIPDRAGLERYVEGYFKRLGERAGRFSELSP